MSGVDRERPSSQQMDRSMAHFRVQKRSYVQPNNTCLPSTPTWPGLPWYTARLSRNVSETDSRW